MMKTFQLIICFVAFLFLTNCARTDEPTTQKNDVMTGVYSLREFSPGFGPIESYNPNDIIWQFMPEKTLIVKINTTTIPANSQMPYKANTTVVYNLTNDATIIINDVTYHISITENKLILDAGVSADGKRIIFDKIVI